jgi:hypothetical protein
VISFKVYQIFVVFESIFPVEARLLQGTFLKEVKLKGVNVEGGVFDGVSKTLHHGRNRPCRVQGRGLKTRLTQIGSRFP